MSFEYIGRYFEAVDLTYLTLVLSLSKRSVRDGIGTFSPCHP